MWAEPVSENRVGDTEIWEFYNFTADAHPMHIHEIAFEVVNREALVHEDGRDRPPAQLTGDLGHRRRGRRLQGHGDRLPGRGHPSPRDVRHRWPVRLALPHRRARGQRDDAAVPDRSGPARSAIDAPS